MSLSAAVIRELVAAGLSGSALVDACERIEGSTESKEGRARRMNADRQARFRDRNASNVTNVTPFPPSCPPSHTQPPLNPPNPVDDAAFAPATAQAGVEAECLAIVAGTMWPVETAQDWYAIRRLIADDGLSFENEILPSIREQVERSKAKGKRIATWGYFANGCREFARQARSPPQPMPSSVSHFPQSRNGNRHDPRANTIENALARLKNIAGGGDASDFADGRPMRTINATAEPG